MIIELLKDFVTETLRLFIEISPYLLLGFLFAGLLHVLLGEQYVQRHFSQSGLWSTIKAAIFGIPLPVCSCAVIPLAESLRKDGASRSATMAFLVSTPSSGVDSIMATYALMGPVYALFRPIASFLSGILVGAVVHFKGDRGAGADEPGPAEKTGRKQKDISIKRFRDIFIYGFKVLPAEISRWLLVGVLVGGAISALVPEDFGARYLGSPFLNYLVVLLISVPLYVCATGSIPIAASLIAKGVLPGAALALLIAGPATNSVTIAFVYKKMGKRIAFYYIVSIIVVSVAAGLIFDAIWASAAVNVDYVTAGGTHLPHAFKWACGILMAAVFVISKYNVNPRKWFNAKRKGNMTPNTTENPNLHTVTVPDMTCRHCEMKIKNLLEQMPGIQSVTIDLAEKTVEVETNGDPDRAAVVERIKKEGYKPY